MKAMRYSFVMVGVWWVLSVSIPYYFLPKVIKITIVKLLVMLYCGFKELKKVWVLLQRKQCIKSAT
jgi:UMF1 family MFS transporter